MIERGVEKKRPPVAAHDKRYGDVAGHVAENHFRAVPALLEMLPVFIAETVEPFGSIQIENEPETAFRTRGQLRGAHDDFAIPFNGELVGRVNAKQTSVREFKSVVTGESLRRVFLKRLFVDDAVAVHAAANPPPVCSMRNVDAVAAKRGKTKNASVFQKNVMVHGHFPASLNPLSAPAGPH